MSVTIHGAAYSTYTRTALMTLREKQVDYHLNEVDIFKPLPMDHLRRHPWGKIPVLDHDGFVLYETAAITRYIDESFPGVILQPAIARDRARMMQVIGITDSYGYRPIISELFVQRAVRPAFGEQSDEARITEAVPASEKALDAILAVMGSDEWVAGAFSLADLHLAPVIAYLRMTPEGERMISARAALVAWWQRISARPSMSATRSPLEK